jgi:ferredoxin-type protein NapH
MPGMHRNRLSRLRLSFQRRVQLAAAVLMNGYALGFAKGKIFTGGTKALCVPVLNCYSCPGALGACPIGSLQAALGGSSRHFPFYVLGLLMLFGVLLGRLACGLLCPFGLVQDLLYKLPTPKWKAPKRLDRSARWGKYLVLLVLVVLIPAFAVTDTGVTPPAFCKYLCPAGTLGGGIPLLLTNPSLRGLAGALFSWKTLILVLILAASVATERPFCRYLCPLGAFYGLFSRFSLFQVQLDKAKCVGCKKCEQACPMAVEVTKSCGTVHSPECIRCGKCKSVCPTGAITTGLAKNQNRPGEDEQA